MMTSRENVPTHVWLPEDQSFQVEITLAILEQLRSFAVAGLTSFRHGGLEVGGVLYGYRAENSVRIIAYAELASEHAMGPAFRLSEADLESYGALLAAPAGLHAVGYFRSHTRTDGADMDESDSQLFDRFFPSSGSVALILKPAVMGHATAAFFLRSESGAVVDTPPQTFTVAPHRSTAAAPAAQPPEEEEEEIADAPPQTAPLEDRISSALPHPQAAAASEAFARIQRSESRSRLRYWWPLPVAASVITLIAYWPASESPRVLQPLSLAAEAFSPGEVKIDWYYQAGSFPRDAKGSLHILDGDMNVNIPLDSERLGLNTVVYPHKSKNLHIRMRVDLGGSHDLPLEREIRFVAPVDRIDAVSLPLEPAIPPQIPSLLERPSPWVSTATPPRARPAKSTPRRRARVTKRASASRSYEDPPDPPKRFEPEIDPPLHIETPEPKPATVAAAPPAAAPAVEPAPEPAAKVEEQAPAAPNGNRFVRALGKINPLRVLKRGPKPSQKSLQPR